MLDALVGGGAALSLARIDLNQFLETLRCG